MLVVVPSYKRFETLRWSLISVFRSGAGIVEPKRLVLVNNDPGTNSEAEKFLGEVMETESAAKDWETSFIGRVPAMIPALSWFGAIYDIAEDGEIAMIHGDDDICLPGSLAARASAIENSDSSFLVSRHQGRLVFSESDRFHSPPFPKPQKCKPAKLNHESSDLANAAFIGNNTYRFDSNFREVLDTTIRFTESQDWLSEHERTLMLPCYLPLVAIHLDKSVACLPMACELRGSSQDDLTKHPFQHPSWNSGFFYGVVLDFLHRSPLGTDSRFDGEREHHRRLTAHWFLAVLADSRIPAPRRTMWDKLNRPRIAGLPTDGASQRIKLFLETSGLKRLALSARFAMKRPRDVRSELMGKLFPSP